jgi:hypothetical protein
MLSAMKLSPEADISTMLLDLQSWELNKPHFKIKYPVSGILL